MSLEISRRKTCTIRCLFSTSVHATHHPKSHNASKSPIATTTSSKAWYHIVERRMPFFFFCWRRQKMRWLLSALLSTLVGASESNTQGTQGCVLEDDIFFYLFCASSGVLLLVFAWAGCLKRDIARERYRVRRERWRAQHLELNRISVATAEPATKCKHVGLTSPPPVHGVSE